MSQKHDVEKIINEFLKVTFKKEEHFNFFNNHERKQLFLNNL